MMHAYSPGLVSGLGNITINTEALAAFALLTSVGRVILVAAACFRHTPVVAFEPGDEHAIPVALAYLARSSTFACDSGRTEATMLEALTIARCVNTPVTA